MLIRSIDFETTGNPSEDRPAAVIEVGWTDIDYEPEATEGPPAVIGLPRAMFVKPNGIDITVDARAVHHISDEDIAGAPEPGVGFMALKHENPSYFCAHNADFERTFYTGAGVPFVCTYKVALRLWPDAPSHSLQALRYWLDLQVEPEYGLPAHRAGPDSYVGAALMARILNHEDCPSLDAMVRWSNGPALLPRITFGKHKGEKWSDLPTDYLEWIVDKSEMDWDAKANAKHWLKQRGVR